MRRHPAPSAALDDVRAEGAAEGTADAVYLAGLRVTGGDLTRDRSVGPRVDLSVPAHLVARAWAEAELADPWLAPDPLTDPRLVELSVQRLTRVLVETCSDVTTIARSLDDVDGRAGLRLLRDAQVAHRAMGEALRGLRAALVAR